MVGQIRVQIRVRVKVRARRFGSVSQLWWDRFTMGTLVFSHGSYHGSYHNRITCFIYAGNSYLVSWL